MTLRDHLHLRVVIAVGLTIAAIALAQAWTVPAIITAVQCSATARGTVVGHARRGRDSEWMIAAFTVDGREYRVRDSVANNTNPPEYGESLDIDYNPHDPNQAALHRIQDLLLSGLAQLTVSLVALFAVLFCIRRHRDDLRALPAARALT